MPDDLEQELRNIASALVDQAPPPPPIVGLQERASAEHPAKRLGIVPGGPGSSRSFAPGITARRSLGAALCAVLVLVAVLGAALRDSKSETVTAAGQGFPEDRGLRLSYVPEGFALIKDAEEANPRGERLRTLEYGRPGDPRSAHLFVTRLVGDPVDVTRFGSRPGFEPAELAGFPAAVNRQGGRVALQWVPAPTVVLAVNGGTGLSGAEVRRVAEGIAYDPALDDLRVTLIHDRPGHLRATMVAEGDMGGAHWELFAYSGDQGLCVGFKYDGRGSDICGDMIGPHRAIAGGPSGGVGWQFVSGPVRKDVTSVRVELDNGGVLSVQPVGAQEGLDVNFYVSAVPPDAYPTRVVALDGSGATLGEVRINRPPARPTLPARPTTRP